MIGYSEREVFSKWEIFCWRTATQVVENAPLDPFAPFDRSFSEKIRCHEMARAVAQILSERCCDPESKILVQDGACGAVEHTWLELFAPGKRYFTSVLDVYAVGRLPMVQLVTVTSAALPILYRIRYERSDVRADDVQTIVKAMRGVDSPCWDRTGVDS